MFSKLKNIFSKKKQFVVGQNDIGHISIGGELINAESLMQVSAAWSAIRLISETVGTLPMHLYKKEKTGRALADMHPAYELLNSRPNMFSSSIEYFESHAVNLCCNGHSYAWNERIGKRVAATHALHKTQVRPEKTREGKLIYHVTRNGRTEKIPYESGIITSIKGFGGANQLEGFAPAKFGVNALGLARAAEAYGSNFFKNGARPTGILMVDATLKEEQRDTLRKELSFLNGSGNQDARMAVLEKMMKYEPIETQNNEAQFIETRKFQIGEAARIWRVPLSLLMENERATYHNTEQESLGFLKHTLRPYLMRIEHALNYMYLSAVERRDHYFQFDVSDLLRGSSLERARWYQIMRASSLITINEGRAKENMTPVEGGDTVFVPLNMAPLEKINEIFDEPAANDG